MYWMVDLLKDMFGCGFCSYTLIVSWSNVHFINLRLTFCSPETSGGTATAQVSYRKERKSTCNSSIKCLGYQLFPFIEKKLKGMFSHVALYFTLYLIDPLISENSICNLFQSVKHKISKNVTPFGEDVSGPCYYTFIYM